jgi:hypothetical protein
LRCRRLTAKLPSSVLAINVASTAECLSDRTLPLDFPSQRRSDFRQSIVGSNLPASSAELQRRIHQSAEYLLARGFSPADAPSAAYSHHYNQLQAQARIVAFMNCFHVIRIVTLIAAPLVLLTKYFKIGDGPAGHWPWAQIQNRFWLLPLESLNLQRSSKSQPTVETR